MASLSNNDLSAKYVFDQIPRGWSKADNTTRDIIEHILETLNGDGVLLNGDDEITIRTNKNRRAYCVDIKPGKYHKKFR